MKKSYQDLNDLFSYIQLISASKDHVKPGSKRERILQKIVNKLKGHVTDMQDAIDEIRLKHAYVDGNGVLRLDNNKDYTFTKPALEAMKTDLKEFYKKAFDFTPIQINSIEEIKEFYNLAGWIKDFPSDEEEL